MQLTAAYILDIVIRTNNIYVRPFLVVDDTRSFSEYPTAPIDILISRLDFLIGK